MANKNNKAKYWQISEQKKRKRDFFCLIYAGVVLCLSIVCYATDTVERYGVYVLTLCVVGLLMMIGRGRIFDF